MDYSSDKNQAVNERPPVFRNMMIENITGEGAPVAVLISGLEDSPIENIYFRNMTVTSTRGVAASNVKGLTFDKVSITPAQGPVFDFTNARDIAIRHAVAPPNTGVFLKLEGTNSGNIRIEASDLTGAKRAFLTGAGVSGDAITTHD